MRLPEAKIKEAVVHPEKLVRQEALLFFADCYSRDAEVMPLAIKAIETYGRSNAFQYVHVLAHLAQTEITVEWAIRELHREEDGAEDDDSYFPALSRLLCSADPQLLAPRVDQILQAPGFFKEPAPEFRERLQLASWDADQCWKELERICVEGVGKHYSSDGDFGHASRVVEALARKGEKYVDPMDGDLMSRLVAVSTVLGVTFPEYPIWKREAEEKLAKQERRMKEMRGFFQAPAKASLPPKPPPEKERDDFLERKPAPFLRTEKQVGRNDPCPCGSGKKFKKCCMNRGK